MTFTMFILSAKQTPESVRFPRRSLLCAQLAGRAELKLSEPLCIGNDASMCVSAEGACVCVCVCVCGCVCVCVCCLETDNTIHPYLNDYFWQDIG